MTVVSTTDLCRLLGTSRETLSKLANRGVLKREGRGRWRLEAVVPAYCAHLREQAAGRASDAGGLDLVQERARLAREQADGQALKNAVARREYLPRAAVEQAVADCFARLRAHLLRLPARLSHRLAAASSAAEVRDALDLRIREALTELSETEVRHRAENADAA